MPIIILTHQLCLILHENVNLEIPLFPPFNFMKQLKSVFTWIVNIFILVDHLTVFSRAHHHYFYPSCLNIYNKVIRTSSAYQMPLYSQKKVSFPVADTGQRGAWLHSPPGLYTLTLYMRPLHPRKEYLKPEIPICITLGKFLKILPCVYFHCLYDLTTMHCFLLFSDL